MFVGVGWGWGLIREWEVGRGELASMHARYIHATIELSAVSLILFCFGFFWSRTLLNCLANSLVALAVWDTYACGFSTVK